MNRKSLKLSGVLLGISLAALSTRLLAADAPTTAPATTQPAARSIQQVMADLNKATLELRAVIQPAVFSDAKLRQQIAPRAIVALKKMLTLTNELGADPRGARLATALRPQWVSLLAIFGDDETTKSLEATAAGTDEPAVAAQATLLLPQWINASSDTPAQTKILEQADAMAKAHTSNPGVFRLLVSMNAMGAAPADLRKRALDAATAMETPEANQLRAQAAAAQRMKLLENQPLVVNGTTVDGKLFTTADWKGKVVLVDFWATWCGPCLAELPRVKKAYADYHDKGLEIIGVSNDYSAAALEKFVSADTTMPWPQLLDKDAAGLHKWNPITLGYGIHGIPTMFLIDKKGFCREVGARADFETEIPKLLAE